VSDVTIGATDALGATGARPLQAVVNLGPLSGTCTLPSGEIDVFYSRPCRPAGGLPPYTCALASGTPPDGLTLNADCSVTGTPMAVASKSFTTRVSDSGGLTVTVGGALTIVPHVGVTTTTLPRAWVNHSYSTTLAAAGGVRPYSWAVIGGALPAGLTLNTTTGTIAGMATMLGVGNVTVRVSDARGGSHERALTLVVNMGRLSGTCALPVGEVGMAYSRACRITGGLPPYTCAPGSGTLPGGLTLEGSCTITGTPATAGSKSFTTRVSDSGGLAVTLSGSVLIQPHLTVTTASLPTARVDRPYSMTLAAAGGVKPFVWSVGDGSSLPAGLTLNPSTGVITGVPTALGLYPFAIHVSDALGSSDVRPLQLVVDPGPLSGACALPPAGLTLNGDCTITGTPTTSDAITPIVIAAWSRQ
jgi:hypothetical protein